MNEIKRLKIIKDIWLVFCLLKGNYLESITFNIYVCIICCIWFFFWYLSSLCSIVFIPRFVSFVIPKWIFFLSFYDLYNLNKY